MSEVRAGALGSPVCVHAMLLIPLYERLVLSLRPWACQLEKFSLQRPLSQCDFARQIFWSEVLNYPCHFKLCKMLKSLLLPNLI